MPDFMGSVRTIKHKLHFHMKWVRQYGASQAARQEGIPLQCRGPGFNPWVENIPWRREWPPAPAFLSGEFHGQRSLVGYNPQGHTEAHMTEVTDLAHTQISIVQDTKKKIKKNSSASSTSLNFTGPQRLNHDVFSPEMPLTQQRRLFTH